MSCHCPDLAELSAFVEGRPTSQPWETLEEHLSSCDDCVGRLKNCVQKEDLVTLHLREAASGGLILEVDSAATRQTPCDGQARNEPLGVSTNDLTAAIDTAPRSRLSQNPLSVGKYRVLERIGEGGMGVVYKAHDTRLDRIVAVKMISAGVYATDQAIARFLREGRAVARLKHPGVVQVYDLSIDEGRPYLVMEYLEGGSLSRRTAGRQLEFSEAAQCVRQLAVAVQAAHDAKILHRDLKPSNVLVSASGEPKLGDFGVAKLLDADDGRTFSDEVLGTACYMAPEQACGQLSEIGPATDVYGLGAILYELIAGRPPFKEGGRMKTLDALRKTPPKPLSDWRPEVPRDLEAVCLKCLAKAPTARYASADELAKELDAWLVGKRTEARPVPRWQAYLRQHHFAAATAAALLLLSIGAPSVAYLADPERRIERIERELVAGENVALIAESGAPAWSRWRTGAEYASWYLDRDGAFTIESDRICLLELLRDPHATHYRFQAEVRHKTGDNAAGGVGIYFTHRDFPTPRGAIHSFQEFVYNDIDNAQARQKALMFDLDEKTQATFPLVRGNVAALSHRFVTDRRVDDYWNASSGGEVVATFETPPAPVWRTLVVDVSPGTIIASWDGIAAPAPLPLVEVERGAARSIQRLAENQPAHFANGRIDSNLAQRGALGLCVHAGSASFRNVSIRSLANRPPKAPKK